MKKTVAFLLLAAAVLPFCGTGHARASAESSEKEENIVISVFWPPTIEYLDGGEGDQRWDEQYKLLSDAHIDLLCNVTGRDRQKNSLENPFIENTREANLKMAKYAAKYGMEVIVAEDSFQNFTQLSEEEISDLISVYKDVPGVGGYYLKDEPYDPYEFLHPYEIIKQTDPEKDVHLNFLPMWAYTEGGTLDDAEANYREAISVWLEGCKRAGYPADYLMYDFYPYGQGTTMNRDVFFRNMRVIREMGEQYHVKTAQYLQSIGGSNRSPNASEIRYEAMVSLAYGMKQLSYFTWFLPTNRTENFFGAIVDDNGVPNPDTYEAVCALNAEIHALGKTLAKLDAREVYLNGFTDRRAVWGGESMIPKRFFLQPDGTEKYTVSLMKDGETGRNYVMLVNNDFTSPVEFSVTLDGSVTSLYAVSKTDGALSEVALNGGKLDVSLAAGDGILYALPEGVNFVKEPDPPEEEDPDVPTPPSSGGTQESGGCGGVIGMSGLLFAGALIPFFLRRKNG